MGCLVYGIVFLTVMGVLMRIYPGKRKFRSEESEGCALMIWLLVAYAISLWTMLELGLDCLGGSDPGPARPGSGPIEY